MVEELQVGTIRKGREIGKRKSDNYIFTPCHICGEARWVAVRKGIPSSTRRGHCRVRINEAPPPSEGARRKMSEAMKRRVARGEHPCLGKHPNREARHNMSLARKGVDNTAYRMMWENPEYILKQMRASQAMPNKLEQRVIDIITEYELPFTYNGDFRAGVTLGGLIPDFININSKKEVIEIFGNYWHSGKAIEGRWRRTEHGRIMAYNNLGYKSLILWENDINSKTNEEIASIIKKFPMQL